MIFARVVKAEVQRTRKCFPNLASKLVRQAYLDKTGELWVAEEGEVAAVS